MLWISDFVTAGVGTDSINLLIDYLTGSFRIIKYTHGSLEGCMYRVGDTLLSNGDRDLLLHFRQ